MENRVSWDAVAEPFRKHVEAHLGGRIVRATTQPAGFSPGSADRVLLADGRRFFIKTIGIEDNPVTLRLHRQEADVLRVLPRSVPAPRLVASVEHAGFFGLILDDIDGRHPSGAELHAALDAFARLPRASGELTKLPRVAEELQHERFGWERLVAADALTELDAWSRAHLDRLREAADRLTAVTDGDHLVHLDARADNCLIDARGAAWIVDWPWASIGAPWLDAVTFLLDARMHEPRIDVEDARRRHPVFADVAAADIDAVLAGLAGSWLDKSRQPAPAGIPGIRDFQRHEARTAIAWLAERWA